MSAPDIVLVDDEKDVRLSYAQSLELAGFQVRVLERAETALGLLGPTFPGILVSDIRMGGMDGMTLLSRVRSIDSELPTVLVTGHADMALAVRAMREGAYDFIEKPFPPRLLVEVATRALDRRRLVLENRRLRAATHREDGIETRLLGRNRAIADLRHRIEALAGADTDAIIVGETGTGKQVVARLLHDFSPRSVRPFVTVDCGALPREFAESELFGHEAGAVSFSPRARYGKFEQAHGGTLLLDGLASLPPDLQARLLAVAETRQIVRIGSSTPIPVDIRILATATQEPDAEIAAGRLRADLVYRLAVVRLSIPPLAERREDVPLLFMHLAAQAAARLGREAPDVPQAMLADLVRRDWPGNVRELRNAAERFVLGLGQDGEFGAEHETRSLAEQTAAYERSLIVAALSRSGGQLKSVYESLGISRKTLYEKMQKFGIDKRDFGVTDRD